MSLRRSIGRSSPAAMVLVLAGSVLAWGGTVAAPETTDGSFDLPTLNAVPVTVTAPITMPTRMPTTATTAPKQPLVFDRIPPGGRVNVDGDHHEDATPDAVGMIEIPRIGLVHPIFEGFDESIIHWGPGHWPGSALPGRIGNAVFAGHRVTHTRPFLDIDLIQAGDQIIFRTNEGNFTYEVTEHLIVTPTDTWIAQPTTDATVTIFACHPKRSAKQRYVVRARMVGSELR